MNGRGALPRAALLLVLASRAHGAFEEKPASARAAGLGEAMTASAEGAEAWLYNPAALRFLPEASAVLGQARLAGDGDLPAETAAFGFSRRRGAFGGAYSQFGDGSYREREASLGAAVFLAPGLAVGAAATGSFLDMDRYGSDGAWGLDAGVLGRPHPRAAFGFAVKRFNHPRLRGAREGLPPSMRVGGAFSLGAARLALDAVKPQARAFSLRAGLELPLAPAVWLRLGGETRPARAALGIGAAASVARIDYAFVSHPFLGDQHQVSLSFSRRRARPGP